MMREMKTNLLLCVVVVFVLAACNSDYVARPRGYYEITFPEKEYQLFDRAGFPYTFEYPVYSRIIRDSAYFDKSTDNPYWVNVDFPTFRGKIYLSYKTVGGTSIYKVKTP